MPRDTLASATPSAPKSRRTSFRQLTRRLTLSRFQAVVGTMAAIASLTGGAFSLVQFIRPADTGELVATVQAAGTRRSVSDATIEVLTTQNAVVATLTPDSAGQATKELREGVYIVRVSHPRYEADVRRIQVLPRQTVEIRASLRAGSSSPIERAVNKVFSAIRGR
jgi:hypothetical protein